MTDCTHHNTGQTLVECCAANRKLQDQVTRLMTENAELRGQVPKWISVRNRAPITQADMEGKCYENADGLFVLTGSSGVQRSDFAAGNTLGYWGKFSYERDVVTHWLEIQIPPQPTNNQSTLHAEGVKDPNQQEEAYSKECEERAAKN